MANMKKIEIKNGPISRTVEVPEGTTVGQLREQVASKLNVTGEHNAYVSNNGGSATAANNDTPVEDGMTVDFMRNTGQKG